MGDTIKCHVYFIDAGNCDIFDIEVDAVDFCDAMGKARDAYVQTENPWQDVASVRLDLIEV